MLDMYGTVDTAMASSPTGGVTLLVAATGDYDADGVWQQDAAPIERTISEISIQGASKKSMDRLVDIGGTANPRDVRDVYINDGTMVYPADEGREADYFKFTDGIAERTWRVMASDCRPWHNYCHAVVERARNADL